MHALQISSKIRSDHLARPALIYIRQSSLMQVRDNTASTARQYNLAERARDLGWPEHLVTVIDQDLGRSGASAVGRDGFEHLIAEVGLGRAGAVVSLEASRLARSCSDWYRLIEICAITDTLVIDEDGVYDPGQYNDRLLLGFRGTMSEAELHWLRCRLLGGKLEKAQHGELRFRLPAGLVYDPTGRIVVDPDEEVRHAVELVFDLFEELGSALAVVSHFGAHGLKIPDRQWARGHKGELAWTPLRHARVLAMLHNPTYAGAYVYGRHKTRTRLLPGEAPRLKGRTRVVPREEWQIVLRENHPGFITWEQFLHNQQRLDDNRTWRAEEHRGAAREGAALLQGIVVCGKCGRRMTVRYMADGSKPIYLCAQIHKDLSGKTCEHLRGDGIDAAVGRLFLEAMEPAHLEVSIAALDQIEARARQIDRQWKLRLERARYEADLARRRFMVTDPENRLVGRSLERDWNAKLTEIEQLEREYASVPTLSARSVSAEEKRWILALAQDLPTVWRSDTTTQVERKQLLRLLIKDVVLTKLDRTIRLDVRWQTNACSTVDVERPKRSCDARRTSAQAVARIRELAVAYTDDEIAGTLNAEGLEPGLGGTFTASKVQWVRSAHGIRSGCRKASAPRTRAQRGDGRYSVQAAAELLNVNISTVAHWCKSGKLDGVQRAPNSPWWVLLTPEIISVLRKRTRQRWARSAAG